MSEETRLTYTCDILKSCIYAIYVFHIIGERSEPPSDKLGGELVCLSLYIYMEYVRPDNQYHAHSHYVRTLTLTPDVVQ